MNELHPLALTLLWGNAVYHGLMGGFCIIDFSLTAKAMKFLYKADLTKNPNHKFLYVLKPIGAFAIILSIMNFWIIFEGSYELKIFFLRLLAFLYLLRLYFRLRYYDLLFKAFQVKKKNNIINVGFNIFLIMIVIYTTRA